MMLRFKYGISYKGVVYGWLNKELYRLPYVNEYNMSFPLKKLKQIMIANNVGYQIGNRKKTIKQLEQLTILINKEVSVIKDADVPF